VLCFDSRSETTAYVLYTCVHTTGKEASTIVIKGADSSSNSSSDSSNSTSSNSTAAVYIGCVWSEGRADADYTLVAGFAQAPIHLQAGVPQVVHTKIELLLWFGLPCGDVLRYAVYDLCLCAYTMSASACKVCKLWCMITATHAERKCAVCTITIVVFDHLR
jgi:hypothetical protein